jgi:hypothetical protein
VNQIAAIWLIVYVAFVLRDAATMMVTISDGIVGLVLLLCSWRLLTETRPLAAAGWLQLACGVWLLIAPTVLRYPPDSPPALNNLVTGSFVTIASAIERWAPSVRGLAHAGVSPRSLRKNSRPIRPF